MKSKIYNIYHKLIEFCRKRNSKWLIYFISFIESVFFPLPTDPFLIPYIIADKKFILLTSLVTVFSVLGGAIAYLLGFFFWTELLPIIKISYPEVTSNIQEFNDKYSDLGVMIILIGGFSPFPYKITCFASGIIGINFLIFIILSFFSRGLRFFLVSYFIHKYGKESTVYIKKNIYFVSLLIIVMGIILYVLKY